MSNILDQSETNSSNMNDITIESEFKLNNFYNKITSIYNKSNKNSKKNKSNIFNRRQSNPNFYKNINILNNFSKDNINYSKSTNQSEENKTKLFLKENKKNQANSLFNNTFLREKQKKFRLNSANMRSYHIYLNCDKPNNSFNIVDNSSKMYQAFLYQTKSNFNNKYNIIYSISDWRKKEQINKLFNSIKKYQNKNDFSNFLENKVNKRCLSAKRIQLKNNLNTRNNKGTNNFSKLLLLNQQYNFLDNIRHKNNLIKIKTMEYCSNQPDNLNKRNKLIFDSSNVFFKTMPLKKK